MNIALLFDASCPALEPDYGRSVLRLVLRTGVIQSRRAHVRVSTGDVLTRMLAPQWSVSHVLGAVYSPARFDRLRRALLQRAVTESTVFCWLLQNLAADAADDMDRALGVAPGYLGALDVSFGDPVQLAFFRQSLPEYFRFRGPHASVLYTGSNEDPDIGLRTLLEDEGMSVVYEDIGARKTAFDPYTDVAHFRRVEYFLDVAGRLAGTSEAVLSELALVIEEIHPALFDSLAAAMRAIDTAQTGEELAQAALSGRRFLEALANHWFPPRNALVNSRKVGPSEYKNRLWAYLNDAAADADPPRLDQIPVLGRALDALVVELNAGLHASVSKTRVEQAFSALVTWMSDAIQLNPRSAARTYLAYEPELLEFFRQATHRPQH